MAYDVELADRIREVVQAERGDPADSESLLSEPHAHRFEMRGRQMDGWLRVDGAALETDEELQRWVNHGVTYAGSLPPK